MEGRFNTTVLRQMTEEEMLRAAARVMGRRGGQSGKGVPKNFSPAEIELRKKRLAEARAKRWPKKKT